MRVLMLKKIKEKRIVRDVLDIPQKIVGGSNTLTGYKCWFSRKILNDPLYMKGKEFLSGEGRECQMTAFNSLLPR